MRKLYLFMMTTLDGYFEGENHDISWHRVDDEFNEFSNKQLEQTDTLIFGHRTYKLMADYWPSKQALDEDPETTRRMNAAQKIVFSHQPLHVDWEHTTASTDVETTIAQLKNKAGKDIGVFGSSNLCVTLLKQGLLDEIRIMLVPMVIGKGTALFSGINCGHLFALKDTRAFVNGNVLLTYTVTGKA